MRFLGTGQGPGLNPRGKPKIAIRSSWKERGRAASPPIIYFVSRAPEIPGGADDRWPCAGRLTNLCWSVPWRTKGPIWGAKIDCLASVGRARNRPRIAFLIYFPPSMLLLVFFELFSRVWLCVLYERSRTVWLLGALPLRNVAFAMFCYGAPLRNKRMKDVRTVCCRCCGDWELENQANPPKKTKPLPCTGACVLASSICAPSRHSVALLIIINL